jgi:hypothetical protein
MEELVEKLSLQARKASHAQSVDILTSIKKMWHLNID